MSPTLPKIPEQLITKTWVTVFQKCGNLLHLASAPDPAMTLQREEQSKSETPPDQHARPNHCVCINEAVQSEDQQVRHGKTKDPGKNAFGDLNPANKSLKRFQLLPGILRQLDPGCTHLTFSDLLPAGGRCVLDGGRNRHTN